MTKKGHRKFTGPDFWKLPVPVQKPSPPLALTGSRRECGDKIAPYKQAKRIGILVLCASSFIAQSCWQTAKTYREKIVIKNISLIIFMEIKRKIKKTRKIGSQQRCHGNSSLWCCNIVTAQWADCLVPEPSCIAGKDYKILAKFK